MSKKKQIVPNQYFTQKRNSEDTRDNIAKYYPNPAHKLKNTSNFYDNALYIWFQTLLSSLKTFLKQL